MAIVHRVGGSENSWNYWLSHRLVVGFSVSTAALRGCVERVEAGCWGWRGDTLLGPEATPARVWVLWSGACSGSNRLLVAVGRWAVGMGGWLVFENCIVDASIFVLVFLTI